MTRGRQPFGAQGRQIIKKKISRRSSQILQQFLKMYQTNEVNNPGAPPNIPVKRKRGRPRKDQSLNCGESAYVPPGFERLNKKQPRQIASIHDANDGMVGQAVTGVVEAAFDAGYLLTVRIGHSKTCLRGLVFKPGCYVPVSAENDVAPCVQMIRRNEIHLPTKNGTPPICGPDLPSRERNEQCVNLHGSKTALLLNGSPTANQGHRPAPRTADLMASKGKYLPLVAAPDVPLVGSRGTVVPVVLQPVNLSNGLPLSNQGPPVASHLMPSNGKQVHIGASQATQPQTNYQVTPNSPQNEIGPFHQSRLEVLEEKAKSMKLIGKSVPDVVNESSSPSWETHTENQKAAGKSSAKDSGLSQEGSIGNTNEPFDIEPLQSIGLDVHNQSAPVTKPMENNRTGRMTGLLQALQESMTQNEASQVEHMAVDSRLESREQKNPETDLEDEEISQKNVIGHQV